jgi:transcriptional regulator with XRE-family HTH domain
MAERRCAVPQNPDKVIVAMRRKGQPHPVDVYVGQRLRLRRTMLNMSQEKLGALLGLTFQQIQKYERGTNRVGASRLWEIARLLDTPMSFFFDGFDAPDGVNPPGAMNEELAPYDPTMTAKRDTLEMIRLYSSVSDPTARRKVLEVMRAIVATMEASAAAGPSPSDDGGERPGRGA